MSKTFSHHQDESSTDLAAHKESMGALAEFLMRSEPPPSSFMSRPESDAGSLHSIRKSFKIFGRQMNKKSDKAPKLLRLPDTAVAATTTSGARHIAISIPREFEYAYETPLPSSAPSSRPQSLSKSPGEKGPVIVLKPVAEVREFGSFVLNKAKSEEEVRQDEDKKASRAGSVDTPAAVLLGPETTRTLKNYYTQLHRQHATTHNSFVAAPGISVARRESTQSDPRLPGGTVYSTASIGSIASIVSAAHSCGPSSASSVPRGSKFDLPPRQSSITKITPAVQAELAEAFLPSKPSTAKEATRDSSLSDQSALSVEDSTSSGAAIGTAEAAQEYNAPAGIQTISRSNTSKMLSPSQPLCPAPTRQLPNVPESPCIPSFFASPSPPISRKHSSTIRVIDDAIIKIKATPVASPTGGSRQSRRDHVKARKQRDLAIHRNKSSNKQLSLSKTASLTTPQILVTAPPKSAKRGSIHHLESIHRRGFNTISAILLVADLPPCTGEVTKEDLPNVPSLEHATKKRVKDSDSTGYLSARGMHTLTSSAGSETDSPASNGFRSRASKNTVLDARRREQRVKRNVSLKETDMDARLAKLERDNTMLMTTLKGIATSFGELSIVLPRAGISEAGILLKKHGIVTDVDEDVKNGGDKSVMRSCNRV